MPSVKSTTIQKLDDFLYLNSRGDEKVTPDGRVSFTTEQAVDQLISQTGGKTWNGPNVFGKSVEVTYSFAQYAENPNAQFQSLNAKSQQIYKEQLARWADVANVTFREVSAGETADISVKLDLKQKSAGYSNYPNPDHTITTAYAWQLTDSDYSRSVTTHEIGHSLGLAHPVGSKSVPNFYEADSAWDLMRGSHPSVIAKGFGVGSGSWTAAPRVDDIAAMQKLYGANTDTRIGDTTYGFNSNTGAALYSITSASAKTTGFTVWDAGGNDTLDFSGYSQNQRISLQDGSLSDVGGRNGNISIAKNAIIENAMGGDGNDIIIGNQSANEIHGGGGDDIIYGAGSADQLWGGNGADTFVYRDVSDSTPNAFDTTHDFTSGQDTIDITSLVSDFSSGNALNFVSTFNDNAGEAVLSYDAVTQSSSLAIDFSGDGTANFLIKIVGQPIISDIIA
ncbi:M57 family metalloprotease [Pseudomonas chlororaphis]|uniref:M57 family metalloprotease n=1 Tax=Pseudomonas chlororaphis TaxID=587753 RepID=UPI001B310D05|nr:M57 family metalloprotease [Pseudomonas chlororaphis]MBP5059562.1 M10 family metallopeptidase C-terminal domain-containing protein [Pseudomonas chlororaphis]MBP5143440.1 M10 family metallopeptidase C-terminal domain-containing protein [Pseudomonas chlororaphis]QTT98270.1 M10 family metallopeptidase C-terminal domain-containing protein [Pseudomonas chlororaphis]